ncbi:hypothetical protein DL93DRAFT_2172218 [Clavulina sp. PMI_390]|nr:hypothetical protein DL93DRAFT_2172218 [Clavulina sp. PMI_390]
MSLLDGLMGSVLISVILSSILFGILTVQAHSYWTRFPNDPVWVRRLVLLLWVVDAAHQIAGTWAMYNYLVRHFLDPTYLAINDAALGTTVTLEPIPALAVQLYFARRLYILNPAWWPMVALIVLLALVAFGMGMACGIIIHTLHFLVEFHNYTWLVTGWLIVCAVCDVLIAISIAYQLWNSRSGFKATDKLLTTLTVWTVNTGMIPAGFAIADAVTFIKLPNTLVHLSLNIMLAKLYSNTAMGFLNRRRSEKVTPRIRTADSAGGTRGQPPSSIHLNTFTTMTGSRAGAYQYTTTTATTPANKRQSAEPNVRFEVKTEQFVEENDEYGEQSSPPSFHPFSAAYGKPQGWDENARTSRPTYTSQNSDRRI